MTIVREVALSDQRKANPPSRGDDFSNQAGRCSKIFDSGRF